MPSLDPENRLPLLLPPRAIRSTLMPLKVQDVFGARQRIDLSSPEQWRLAPGGPGLEQRAV
jgi:hypothetical protein